LRKISVRLFIFLFVVNYSFSQTGILKGVITDENGKAIEGVSIRYEQIGTVSTSNGSYELKLPSGRMISIVFSHVSFETITKRLRIPRNRSLIFSPKMREKTEEIKEVIVRDPRDQVEGVDPIDTETAKQLPSANPGIEATLRNIGLGVSGTNELSTQYNVRGGNYDENLVYINGIEVYRPFLVRSGQQEGLSFVNPNLTQNVKFSAGGFQAKYGDKLSSVLDITYRKAGEFRVSADASFLGASLTVEGKALDKKVSALLGVRYRNNSLFVNSRDIETNFRPNFTDVQSFITYDPSERLRLEFLGNFSLNNYDYTPVTRRTNFGSVAGTQALVVNYEGREEDQYLTLFGALKASYRISDDFIVQLTSSAYNAQEEEYFDILANYGIGQVNADFGSDNFGNVQFVQAIGSQLDHARNDLDALIANVQLRATLKSNEDLFEFGVKYQVEDIKDRIVEWEVIDSAGFSLRPPTFIPTNDEPYEPFTGPLVPFSGVRAFNEVRTRRLSGYAQWSRQFELNEHQLWVNLGVRGQHWKVTPKNQTADSHTVISPRAQLALKPDWEKDMLFRLSGGYYYQPPFYRELRDSLGAVNPSVKAQQSIHVVLGADYSFKLWDRPFKLVTEAYYKSLSDVNPFTIDNVQIRYRARNIAKAYAAGFDARLSGEFVPGTESYFTLGYLSTQENIENRGYIARPTDQRLKFAILYQDYLPSNPNLKMYLNLVYNTGVPGGSPAYADPYIFQNRLRDYFRSDIGISYVLVDQNKRASSTWLEKFKQFSIGIELFNMFDVQNSITNTWVRDIAANQSVAVPNFLSGRVLNFKVAVQF